MKILVLGCGIQGRAAAYDLVQSPKVSQVVLADRNHKSLKATKSWLKSPKVRIQEIDIRKQTAVRRAMKGMDAVLNSAPYEFCLGVTQAAIAAKVSLVDLGGDTTVVRQQLKLAAQAKKAGITIIPDCGVSPGITNVMVGHGMNHLDSADEVWIRDGGLPQNPQPPLFYAKLFSIDVLMNEYTGKTTAVRDSKIVEVDSLTEVETVDFDAPVGRCEATHGMGMLSSLPWTYSGRIRNMDNKFVRYPGHIPFFQTLKQLGFLKSEATKQLLEHHLESVDKRDLYVIQIVMKGKRNGKPVELRYSLTDFFDEKTCLSSMSRTTGFAASIVAQMLATASLGKGVLPPELALPQTPFFEELRKRGIQVHLPSL